jgi:hypothetical protein
MQVKYIGNCLIFNKIQHLSHRHQRKEKNCLNCGTQVIGKYCQACGQENAEPKDSAFGIIQHFLYNEDAMNKAIRETDSSIAVLHSKTVEEKQNEVKFKKLGDSVLVKTNTIGITIDSGNMDSKGTGGSGFLKGSPFSNVRANKLYQQHMPDSLKDKTIKNAVLYRAIKMKEQGEDDRLEPVRALMNSVFHTFPQLLFISLPIFALILNILYIRRKQYVYVDHVIFTVHLFCATFIYILLIALSAKLKNLTGSGFFSLLSAIFILLNMAAGMVMTLLLMALLIISAIQI